MFDCCVLIMMMMFVLLQWKNVIFAVLFVFCGAMVDVCEHSEWVWEGCK